MIRQILIDVDNTLLNFDQCAKYAMQQGLLQYGIPYTEEIFSVFLAVNDKLWGAIEDGTLTREALYAIRWQMIFDCLGIEENGARFEQVFLSFLAESHIEEEGAFSLLEYLSKKYTLSVISNAPYQQQKKRLANGDMLRFFQHLFVSEAIGYAKPQKAFFDHCFSAMGNPPKSEVLLIGDSLNADIGGGNAYGVATCWYNPKGKTAPHECTADYIVTSLKEIRTLL